MIQLRPYQQELYDKTVQAFRSGYRRPLVVAPCGAGKTVLFAKMAADTKGDVLILTHRHELLQQTEKSLRGFGVPMGRVRVAMVQTESNRLGRYPKPRLVIADEAHLSRSNSWMKVIDHYDTFTVGFTATPCRLDNKPLGDVFDILIEGIGVPWLISNGYLAPFEYYAPVTADVDSVRVERGDYVAHELEELMMSRAIYGDVIRSYQKLVDGRKTICYCVSVKHAESVADRFREAGYTSECISGSTPSKRRAEVMAAFRRGDIQVLCNCALISEGVSIDDCDVCILLRPTLSTALGIQQMMRCMRYQPGKTAVIIDCVGNYTRVGLPDEHREWSLTSDIKPRKILTDAGDYAIRTCPTCFKVFESTPVCPYCLTEYPLSPREIKAHEEIELEKIGEAEREAAETARKEARKAQGMARTFPELVEMGKARGYRNPHYWAQQVLRGRKK